MRKDVAVLMVLWVDVYTIRYLYMCLSHSEQIRYAESFSSKKNYFTMNTYR